MTLRVMSVTMITQIEKNMEEFDVLRGKGWQGGSIFLFDGVEASKWESLLDVLRSPVGLFGDSVILLIGVLSPF